MKYKFIKNKNFTTEFLLILFLSALILTPLILYGHHDFENYETNHFTLKINLENFLNQFNFYFDLYGPGTTLPLDTGFFYLFPSFFIFDIKIFFMFVIILSIFIQLKYLKKICKLLKLYSYELIIFFIIINNVTLTFVFTHDYLKGYFAFSCLSIIYYYYLKFIIKNHELSFLKLFLVLCYFILNTHLSLFFVTALSLIIFTIINKKLFFILKKKVFYFCLILFIFIISEHLFNLYGHFKHSSEAERQILLVYDLKYILSGFIFLVKFIVDFFNVETNLITGFTMQDNEFKPFAGFTFYFSIIYSLNLLYSGRSQKIFNLNILFLIFFTLGFFDTRTLTFNFLNHAIYYSFITNFLNVIIFGHYLANLKYKNFSKYILLFCIIFQISFYLSNINYKKNNHDQYSYLTINNNYEKSDLHIFFKNFKNNNYNKLYLSPQLWEEFWTSPKGKPTLNNTNKLFTEANIFNQTDFFDYNLYPFQGYFKDSSKEPLVKSGPSKFQWYINSKYTDINNQFFFNLFNINYLFIYEDEISNIDLKKFKIVKSFENYKKTILFLKLKDQRKVVLKNPVSNFDKCGSSNSVYCIIENADNFEKSDLIFFKRKGLNTYLIKNEDNKAHNIILPFLYDKSWKTNKKNLSNINNSLIYVNLKSKEDLNLFYQNNLRILLKIVSLITFILCFVIILKKSIKFKN